MILSSKKFVPGSMPGLLSGAVLALSLSACGGGGGGGGGDTGITEFSNFQAAKVVIGQPDFNSGEANQGGERGAGTLWSPRGNVAVTDGIVYSVDTANNRILGFEPIPTVDGEPAEYVWGQTDFVASATDPLFRAPQSVSVSEGRFIVTTAGADASKVLIWNSIPTPGDTPPPLVTIGTGTPGCDYPALNSPSDSIAAGGKLIVVDTGNNRILVWDQIPEDGGNIPEPWVLGQANLTTCDANAGGGTTSSVGFSLPFGVWSDGDRLAVVDARNGRVLLWDHFPTVHDQAPDRVLGAASVGGTPMNASSVHFSGDYLLVSDDGNNRVLIWKGFPATNDQPADFVLGQGDLAHTTANDDNQNNLEDETHPTARTLSNPRGAYIDGKRLFVTDNANNRVLIFEAP